MTQLKKGGWGRHYLAHHNITIKYLSWETWISSPTTWPIYEQRVTILLLRPGYIQQNQLNCLLQIFYWLPKDRFWGSLGPEALTLSHHMLAMLATPGLISTAKPSISKSENTCQWDLTQWKRVLICWHYSCACVSTLNYRLYLKQK